MQRFDYIVIGSGAGGSAAAFALAETGRSILILERGEELPVDLSKIDAERIASDEFRTTSGFLFQSKPSRHEEFTNVGGKTKWYGATLMRFTPDEFTEEKAYACPGWPVSAQEFAPFYEEVERQLGVRVFALEPGVKQLVATITAHGSGWESSPQPLALIADVMQQPEIARRFNGNPMPLGLKGDADAFLTPLRQRANVTIVTGEAVVALEADPVHPRRVTAVRCRSGATFHGGHFLLAAGALNSPRLLADHLRQTGLWEQIPGADNIGRFYKCHPGVRMLAISPRVQTDILRKTICFRHPKFPHGIVQSWAYVHPEFLSSRLPGFVPRWLVEQVTKRMVGFLMMTEEGSHPDNRVTGPADGPANLDYDLARTPEALAEHLAMQKAFRRLLLQSGYLMLPRQPARYSTSHAVGTLIAGTGPQRSVVDAAGQVYGLENVSVADGSALPRIGRENPALSIYAWGMRTGRLLANRPVPLREE